MKKFKVNWQTADNTYGEIKTIEARTKFGAKNKIRAKVRPGTKIKFNDITIKK